MTHRGISCSCGIMLQYGEQGFKKQKGGTINPFIALSDSFSSDTKIDKKQTQTGDLQRAVCLNHEKGHI